MGSYWGWSTRRALIEDLTKSERTESEDGRIWERNTIARACVGNDLWSVVEITRHIPGPGNAKAIHRAICLDKMMCSTRGRGYNKITEWGHKPLSEEMFPYSYSCPLKFLKMVPIKNWEWRLRVMGYWAAREYRAARKREAKLFTNVMRYGI